MSDIENRKPDPILDPIASFASTLRFEDLPKGVVHDCRRRLIDSIGCGLGAFHENTSEVARDLATRVQCSGAGSAQILGCANRSLPELAAFANGMMVRCLDGNDTFVRGGGHPSDVIPAVLAVVDSVNGNGKSAIAAIAAAYEVYHHFHEATFMREKGWDYTVLTALGSAMGAANALKLDKEQTANAGGMVMTANHALLVARRGAVSEWRGCAAPYAARNGVFATLLAARGISGPSTPAVGVGGLFEHFGPFELSPFPPKQGEYALSRSQFKSFLCEYHAQGVATASLELFPQIQFEEIEKINVYIYAVKGLDLCDMSADRVHPKTRESADHSIHFIISALLIDGVFSDSMFAPDRLGDPRIHALSERIRIYEDKAYSARFPQAAPCRIEIETKGGQVLCAEVEYPKGHPLNAMSDKEVEQKYLDLATRALPRQQAEGALDLLWRFDEAETLAELMNAMDVKSSH